MGTKWIQGLQIMSINISSLKKEKMNPFVFFAVFFSSMLGAQIYGISLNKIALLPLEIYLFTQFTKGKYHTYTSKNQRNIILWYIVIVLSSIIGLTRTEQLNGYEEKLFFNIVQYIAIYLPILLMIGVLKNPFEQFKKAIIIIAKINSLWAITQFIAWYVFHFDFNNFFFSNCLKGLLGTNWTAWNFEAGTLAMRATGLNNDPAFLAVLMVLGFTFSKSYFWKTIFVFTCICAMSRVGLVTIMLVIITTYFKPQKKHFSLPSKKILIRILAVLTIVVLTFLYLYNFVEFVQYQTDYMLTRFSVLNTNTDTGDISGTKRHIMYIPLSILTLCELPGIEQIFGVGPRIGGTALVFSDYTKNMIELNSSMRMNAWAIECDFAENLLGTGILGFSLYYFILFSLIKANKRDKSKKNSLIGIFFFGFMYCIALNSLINLYFIFLVANNYRLQDKNDYGTIITSET